MGTIFFKAVPERKTPTGLPGVKQAGEGKEGR